MPYQAFETERLMLQPTVLEDDEFVLKLLNTPKWIEHIGDRNVKTIESARKYILEKMHPQLDRLGYSNYTVIRKSDESKIGSCGLYDREGLAGIDIGFAFLPEYEKNGYGFEVGDKLKNLAFNEFGLKTLSAITSKNNTSSQRLLEKLGLAFIGTTKLPNNNEELLLYQIQNENGKLT